MSLHEGRAARAVQTTAGFAVIGLGGVALAGWFLDATALHTWRPGTVPMAPVTAVLFALLGLVLVILGRGNRPADFHIAGVLAAFGAVTAGGMLMMRLLGWYPPIERLGLVTPSPSDIGPVGFVSPLTAGWFVLAQAALCLALPRPRPAPRWRLRAAPSLAALATMSSGLLLVMSIYGPPLLLGKAIPSVAVATASGMIVTSLGLIALAIRRYHSELDRDQDAVPGPGRFAVVFVVVATVVITGAYVYFRGLENAVRHQHVAELEAVSELKSDQLSQWRRERLGDAAIVHGRVTTAQLTASLVRTPADPALRSAMGAWFQAYAVYEQYDRLMIFDPAGELVMSYPDMAQPDQALSAAVQEHLRSGVPGLLDFRRRNPDGRATLSLVIPMSQSNSPTAIGVICLDIDPSRFLYPLLDRWPSSNTLGETLLMAREVAHVVVLNTTRLSPYPPLTLRMSLSSGTIGARGMNGERGIVQGVDYAGRPVLAIISAIPDSPWLLITKINEDGVRAAVLRQLWMVVSLAGLILLSAGGGLAVSWRLARERHFLAEATLLGSLQVTTGKLSRLVAHSPTIVYTLNRVGPELIAEDISENIERLFGYTTAEALAPGWWVQHLHPDDLPSAMTAFGRIEAAGDGDTVEHEYRFQRVDGGYLWVLDQLQVVARGADGAPTRVAGAWTDISSRREAERTVRDNEHRLQLALSAAKQGMWDLDLRSGTAAVSPQYAAMMGYDPSTFVETHDAWRARLHPDDQVHCKTVFDDYVGGRRDTYRVEFRQRTADGAWIWILSEGQIVERGADGAPHRMIGTHIDITARKEAELRATRLARLYAALSACNEATVRCRTEEELFARVCMAAVDNGGFAMAWVGKVDASTGLIVPVSSYGDGLQYLDGIQVSVDSSIPQGQGPTGTAIRENQPYFVMNFATDPATAPWHERAARFGWATSAALPLMQNNTVIGALTIYSRNQEDFDDDGRRLMLEMATDISFALDAMHRDRVRVEAETALRQSVHEKEALLKEVHHRVKNNLQVISSLLRLETGRTSDGGVKSVLTDMQTRVLSMALLHETLYRSGNLAKVDLSTYLTQLAHQVFHSAGPLANRITLELDIAPLRVNLDQAVPCGLLLNELLSNSLKHAFPDGRTGAVGVSLQMSTSSSAATLEVFDTGVGLPVDLAERQRHSLGLQLVYDLTRQLGGTMTVTSDHGARWHLVFTPRPTAPDEEHAQ